MKVNTLKRPDFPPPSDGWTAAVILTERYQERPVRADLLLAELGSGADPALRRSAQQLFYAVIRGKSLLEAALGRLCAKAPQGRVRALLLVAGAELLECGADVGRRAKATDWAVRKAGELLGPRMTGFVNAIVRRLPESLEAVRQSGGLSLQYSHPEWLVARWEGEFGAECTKKLLEWDQLVPPVYIRLEEGAEAPASLKPAQWPGYFSYEGGGWGPVEALLAAGRAYAQDPSTRLCVDILDPKPGEKILDLCAAPGGKARLMLPRLGTEGRLICVDLPERCGLLEENLKGRDSAAILGSDVFALSAESFSSRNLPELYDAVLLDAPCSNTGVLRRRPDARWRLQEGDIEKCARLQFGLLKKAAEFVRPGGRLVYSTCSVEYAENDGVAEAFLKANPNFTLKEKIHAYPWETGHDGAGAFAFVREG
jgi:16S rRNA (cytosine967-C5)-methyltransferase